MTHHKSDKCIGYDKLVYNTSKDLVCQQCSNLLHLKCSRLNKKRLFGLPTKSYTIPVNFALIINIEKVKDMSITI